MSQQALRRLLVSMATAVTVIAPVAHTSVRAQETGRSHQS